MKKFAFPLLCLTALLLSACSQGQKQEAEAEEQNTELNDSLQTVNAEKDSLMAIVSEISDGMTQIKSLENLLNSSNLSTESPNKKQQIVSDMVIIKQALAERRERLATLEARLSKSNHYSAEMKKTVESLKAQIETQEQTITTLQDQLKEANVKIDELTTSVDSLQKTNEKVTTEKIAVQEEAARLTTQINTCYYAVGSKSELKAHKIIETGFLRKTKVMESDFEISYFTRADKRTLTEIPLHSAKAKVLSKHPSGSYALRERGTQKVLVINNATRFWELSNYLIVQIN